MSSLIEHAKRELELIGYGLNQTEEGPNKWMYKDLLELLEVFSKQGHSGFSAPYCISMFSKLAKYEPLSPLTGEDDEWNDVSGKMSQPMWQNKRCSEVFKDGDGRTYWIRGKIFRDKDGDTYTSGDSHVDITFPWIKPEPEIVDVDAQVTSMLIKSDEKKSEVEKQRDAYRAQLAAINAYYDRNLSIIKNDDDLGVLMDGLEKVIKNPHQFEHC